MTTLAAAVCGTCGVSNDEHVIKPAGYVLLVKGTDHDNAEEVVFERFEDMFERMPLNASPCDIEADLNAWLLEDSEPPFSPNTLLWWQRGV